MDISDIDDTALKQAFASGDEAAVDREWHIWIAKLEAKAAADPVFGKWFEDFRADQGLLLRWDDMLDEMDDNNAGSMDLPPKNILGKKEN